MSKLAAALDTFEAFRTAPTPENLAALGARLYAMRRPADSVARVGALNRALAAERRAAEVFRVEAGPLVLHVRGWADAAEVAGLRESALRVAFARAADRRTVRRLVAGAEIAIVRRADAGAATVTAARALRAMGGGG